MSDVTVTLNGKPRQVEDGVSLLELLKALDVAPSRVVIEHNREIRRKDDFAKTVVHDGDELELVYFVGGGSTADDAFVVGGRTLRSRLIHGTGKYPSNEVLAVWSWRGRSRSRCICRSASVRCASSAPRRTRS